MLIAWFRPRRAVKSPALRSKIASGLLDKLFLVAFSSCMMDIMVE